VADEILRVLALSPEGGDIARDLHWLEGRLWAALLWAVLGEDLTA
jgi:hypothetical protein